MLSSNGHKSIVSKTKHNRVVDVVDLFKYRYDELGGEHEASKGRIHGYDPFRVLRAMRWGSIMGLTPSLPFTSGGRAQRSPRS